MPRIRANVRVVVFHVFNALHPSGAFDLVAVHAACSSRLFACSVHVGLLWFSAVVEREWKVESGELFAMPHRVGFAASWSGSGRMFKSLIVVVALKQFVHLVSRLTRKNQNGNVEQASADDDSADDSSYEVLHDVFCLLRFSIARKDQSECQLLRLL